MSKHKNLCTGVMKFTILVDPSFGIITIYLVCLNHAPEYRRYDMKYNNFTLYTPQNYLPLGWWVMKFTILVSLPYRCYIPNLVKIGPVVLE